jgi:hypothetical protein
VPDTNEDAIDKAEPEAHVAAVFAAAGVAADMAREWSALSNLWGGLSFSQKRRRSATAAERLGRQTSATIKKRGLEY